MTDDSQRVEILRDRAQADDDLAAVCQAILEVEGEA